MEGAENNQGGGMVEAPEAPSQDVSNEYVNQTISSAVDRMPEARYLREQEEREAREHAEKQPKKQKPKTQPEPDEEDEDEPTEPKQPPAEPEPEEDEEEEDSGAIKSQAKWDQYRKGYRESVKLKAEVADLRQKVAQLSDRTETETLKQQLQGLLQERGQLMHHLEIGNVEATSHWQQAVVEPLDRMWTNVQAIAKRNSLDPYKIVHHLQAGDDVALDEYIAEARPGDRQHLFSMIPALENVEHQKRYLRENAQQIGIQDYQNHMAQQQAHWQNVTGQRHSAIDRIAPKLEERAMRYIPQEKRQDLRAIGPSILNFEGWKEDAKMYAGMAGVILPDLLDSMKATRAELKAAKAELAKMRGGGPKNTVGKATPSRTVNVPEEEDEEDLNKPLREITAGMATRARAALGYR